jgi:hypothetical protein
MMRMAEPQQADVLVERESDCIANTPCPRPSESSRSPSWKKEAVIVATGAPREPGRPPWVVLGVLLWTCARHDPGWTDECGNGHSFSRRHAPPASKQDFVDAPTNEALPYRPQRSKNGQTAWVAMGQLPPPALQEHRPSE